MPRKLKLTWQPGSGGRSGRWRKKYKGQSYYFAGGRGKSDREAYDAALAAWERKKVEIDAALPKRYQSEYARAIREWEAVLNWCRKHPGEDQMAATALAKLDRLRNHFAAFKPKPVTREDTFEGQFVGFACPPELAEAITAALKNVEFEPPESLRQVPSYQTYLIAARAFMADVTADGQGVSQVIDPREFNFLGKLDDDPNQEKLRIWQDRLDVMRREAAGTQEQSVAAYAERFYGEKKAAMTTGQLSAHRYCLIRSHLDHFRDWLGSEASVAGINGKVLSDYRLALLANIDSKNWSRATASARLDCVKQFVRWLWQVDAIASLPRIMDSHSNGLHIAVAAPTVIVFTMEEIATQLAAASDRTKLYMLLMLNCGMTQKDIADLDLSELDWEAGRIRRKRSKTRACETVPLVCYSLWPETLRLLQQERTKKKSGRVLLNEDGKPLWSAEAAADGKLRRCDNIRDAFWRLQQKTGITKPLKSFKKTAASLLRDNPRYASLENLYLGHAPRSLSDRHYTLAPQTLFDEAIQWLGTEFRIVESVDVVAPA